MDDRQIQHGQAWLQELLELSGFSTQVYPDRERTDTEGSCWLTIDDNPLSAEEIQTLTGEGGLVLDALQYLANTTLNLGQEEEMQTAYTIELAGYRAQRQVELQDMAEQAIQHVRQTGEEYELASLSSAERRQIHTYLKEFADLETFSRGREPDRRLVIRLAEDTEG